MRVLAMVQRPMGRPWDAAERLVGAQGHILCDVPPMSVHAGYLTGTCGINPKMRARRTDHTMTWLLLLALLGLVLAVMLT